MRHGFTLVEMSIVLAVIGLLTGGILAGQNLIKGAEMRSVINDYNRYTTAIIAFREKYDALPGDFADATSIWGTAHATPATCVTTTTGDERTCNGDDDEDIDLSTGSNEYFRSWQHMANAGLISGNFSGIAGSLGTGDATLGTNAPATRIANVGWAIYAKAPTGGGGGALFTGRSYGIRFQFGTRAASNGTINSAAISTADAYAIDVKLDDGKPGYGIVLGPPLTSTTAPGCTTADDFSTSQWSLNSSGNLCGMVFQPLGAE